MILYRGWGAGEKHGQSFKMNNRRDTQRTSWHRPTISPELRAAIRLECGLKSSNQDEGVDPR